MTQQTSFLFRQERNYTYLPQNRIQIYQSYFSQVPLLGGVDKHLLNLIRPYQKEVKQVKEKMH